MSGAPPRRLVVFAPMRPELRPLTQRLPIERVATDEGRVLYSGRVESAEVHATITTMGTAAAAACAEQMLDAFPTDHVVVVGVAGAVDPRVAVGEVVVPAVVVDDASGDEFRSSPLGSRVPTGRIVTSDMIFTAADLPRFIEAGVTALDMETAAIARVCEQRGIRWTAFRAMSDRLGDGHLDPAVFALARPDGSPNIPAALRYALRRPWRIPRLVQYGRQASAAADAAAAAAVDAITLSVP